MEDKILCFSTLEMIKWLNKFDAIHQKYLIPEQSDQTLEQKVASFRVSIYPLEQNEQNGFLQKMPTGFVGKTMESIYGARPQEKLQSAQAYAIVKKVFINEFLNIKGLELLFKENYYPFEWDMHLEYNFEKGESNYYRDHMEHQIRNMYMILELLNSEELGFMRNTKNILMDSAASKLSKYVSSRFKSFCDDCVLSEKRKAVLYEGALLFFSRQIFKKWNILKGMGLPDLNDKNVLLSDYCRHDLFSQEIKDGGFCTDIFLTLSPISEYGVWDLLNRAFLNNDDDKDRFVRAYVRCYSLEYIIRSAGIISALFHDISYPLCFYMQMQKRIGEYLPSMNAFTHTEEADLDRILSLLQPSLLYTLVGGNELRDFLKKHQKKYDHGVLSSVTLLLSLYESGLIHSLPQDKQLAVELAAVAIYNHNYGYRITGDRKSTYYRPVFIQNPISYLLKMCDEMQEWNRKYFEISGDSQQVYCPDCKMPILKYAEVKFDSAVNKNCDPYSVQNKCFCGCKEYDNFEFFPSRDMYVVSTCDTLQVYPVLRGSSPKEMDLVFQFGYSPMKLLHMSRISATYSWYRANELSKLKLMLSNQRFYSNETIKEGKILNIYLSYIMSNNPLFLKAIILLMYLIRCFIGEESWKKYLGGSDILTLLPEEIKKAIDYLSKNIFINTKRDDISVFQKNKKQLLNIQKDPITAAYLVLNKDFLPIKEMKEQYRLRYPKGRQNIEKILNDVMQSNENALIDCLISRTECTPSFGLDKIKEKLKKYLELSRYIYASFRKKQKKEDMLNALETLLNVSGSSTDSFNSLLYRLLDDFCDIISKQQNLFDGPFTIDTEKYQNQYKTEEDLPVIVEKYCYPANWYKGSPKEYNNFAEDNIDYYSDLFLFEKISAALDPLSCP